MTYPAAQTWDRISSIMLTTSELERLSAGAKHGTHARYNAHLLAGDEPCDPCRDAETTYRAELRARRSDRDADQARSQLILRPRRASDPATALLEAEDDEAEEEDDENEDERSWADGAEEVEQDDEEFELDDAPATARAANLMRTWQTIGQMGGLRLGLRAARPSRTPRRSRISSAPEPTPSQDPRARLRAITAELDSRKPRGSNAIELLVEAASYLTGGVVALRQYAEARGCDPEDARTAERAVLAQQELERAGEHLPDRQDVLGKSAHAVMPQGSIMSSDATTLRLQTGRRPHMLWNDAAGR